MQKRINLTIIFLLLLALLSGCLPISLNVQNVDYGKYMAPFRELNLSDNRIDLQVNDSYAIDATVNMELSNPNSISEYEIQSKRFTEEEIRHIFNDNSNWETLDGALLSSEDLEDLNEDTYIPFRCESEDHTIYVNEKRGILNYASESYVNAASDFRESNKVEISQIDSRDFADANQLVNSFIQKLDSELISTDNEVYHDDESYYWCFHYAQAMDGIKIVHDAVGVYSGNVPYLPKVEIILKDNELYFFSGILMEKVKSIHDYEKVISLNGAVQIIADKSNLLLETGRDYMRGNGQVAKSGQILAKEVYIAYYPLRLGKSVSRNKLVPIWFFWSGDNIGTDAYFNVKINAVTGEIL